MAEPNVLADPRFRAGRTLVTTGRADEGGFDVFATLVEEARQKYGEASMEAAACYYEYGNALFRAANRRLEDQADFEPCRDKVSEGNSSSAKGINKAMEDRAKKAPVSLKLAAEGKSGEEPSAHAENYMVTVENGEQIDGNAGARAQAGSVAAEEKEDDSDISLALEMMENAWSILDEHVNGNAADKAVTQNEKKSTDSRSSSYTSWAKEQLPRILIGIGDVLSFMNRHADAAAAYIRSIPFREEVIQNYKSKDTNENQSSQIPSLENLRHHRLLTETYALVAQELLACPSNENVITSEFREVLVSATERIDYSRGYYEKARDELQETVVILGKIAVAGHDLGTGKEDVCFLATILMGVGEKLAAVDEGEADAVPPVKKLKAK